MGKNPSTKRTSDLTHYRQSKANQKKRSITKLREEIAEHERVLKQHPMGAITLNATIKEKRAKLEEMTKNIKKFHKLPTQVGQNAEALMERRANKGLKGLRRPIIKGTLLKAVVDDGTLRKKRAPSLFSQRDSNAPNIASKFRTTRCADANLVEKKADIGSNCHGQISLRKQSTKTSLWTKEYLCKFHFDVRCGMYLGL